MRGAHRDVWCSKVTPLIEAELFAAERCRPAPSGRALLCAAVDARKIQGLTASHKRNDARNRAPVTPVSLRDRRESRRKGGFGGVKRGQGNHTVPLPPFVSAARRRQSPSPWARRLRRQTAAIPLAVGTASPPPDGGNPGLPIGSHSSPAAASRRNGGTASPPLRGKKSPCPEGAIKRS